MEGELRESTESVGVDPTWLCGTWALISCCAWAYSLFQIQSDSLSGGALTACAFALAFIGYWVRRRALDQNSSMQEGKREIPNHSLTGLAMMLGLAASVNWLGVLVQYSASLGDCGEQVLVRQLHFRRLRHELKFPFARGTFASFLLPT